MLHKKPIIIVQVFVDEPSVIAFKCTNPSLGVHVLELDASVVNNMYDVRVLSEDAYNAKFCIDPDFIYNHSENDW